MSMIQAGLLITLEMFVFNQENGVQECPFETWYQALDKGIRVRVATRLERLKLGNLGNHRWLDTGILELKFTIGPGYRIYCAEQLVLLLVGGDKASQSKDIDIAKRYWQAYQNERQKENSNA